MRKDLILTQQIQSSFFSCPDDTKKILEKLFVESRPYSDKLKRLLLVNNPDCLDMSNQEYQKLVDDYSLGRLLKEGYVRLDPKIARTTFEDVKSYIYIYFDDFAPTKNINELVSYSIDNETNELKINVISGKSYKPGFDISYGNITKHIVIKSL